jgi:outer membrane immunogenic protein
MRKSLLALIAPALLAAAAVARADNGLLYVGAGISHDSVDGINVNGFSLSDLDNTSWKALVGVRPVSYFGIEGDYLDLGGQRTQDAFGSAHTSYRAFTGYAVGYVPLPVPFLDVFGKAGLTRWSSSGSTGFFAPPPGLFSLSDNGTEFAWGVGAQVHLGNLAARLEYEGFNLPNTNGARIASLDLILYLM